jgi:glucose-6-phosphate dehydrogenase assembly protein OpcA
MSADNMRTGANLNVRTSVLNLVICTPDTESAQHANNLLGHLSSNHLARAIIAILDNDEQAPSSMTTWVTLRCFSTISDLMRQCFEQATLLTSGMAAKKISNSLPSLLKANLPAFLWWIGDIKSVDESVFHEVARLCQRVIVDSATFFQPEQDIHTLASYAKHAPEVALGDLNWSRLTPWLQLVAQFFDIPEYLPFLADVENIEIEHAVAPLAIPSASVGGSVSPESSLKSHSGRGGC